MCIYTFWFGGIGFLILLSLVSVIHVRWIEYGFFVIIYVSNCKSIIWISGILLGTFFPNILAASVTRSFNPARNIVAIIK